MQKAWRVIPQIYLASRSLRECESQGQSIPVGFPQPMAVATDIRANGSSDSKSKNNKQRDSLAKSYQHMASSFNLWSGGGGVV